MAFGSNYPYAVARVQAKRGKLIPRTEYEKLLKMDVSEITQFIQDSEYRAEVDELAARFEGLDLLEAALTVNEERTYASVRRMLKGDGGRVVAAFLDRYVGADVKAVLRGKNAGLDRDELLRELLLQDMEAFDMFTPLLGDDIQSTDDVIEALDRQGGHASRWAKVLLAVPSGSDLPAYEDAIDRAGHARLRDAVDDFKGKGRAGLRSFVKREIDAVNLQNAARWVAAGNPADFSPYVLPGGLRYGVSDIMQLAESPDLEAFEERLDNAELQAAMADARASSRLARFSVAVRNGLYADLDRLAHEHPISVVPVLSYLLRKHEEVVRLRGLARGKSAGLAEERLREVLA